MAELKDKDEQYSIFLQYKENKKTDEKTVIFTLRAIFITFLAVILFSGIAFIFNHTSEIENFLTSFAQTK